MRTGWELRKITPAPEAGELVTLTESWGRRKTLNIPRTPVCWQQEDLNQGPGPWQQKQPDSAGLENPAQPNCLVAGAMLG